MSAMKGDWNVRRISIIAAAAAAFYFFFAAVVLLDPQSLSPFPNPHVPQVEAVLSPLWHGAAQLLSTFSTALDQRGLVYAIFSVVQFLAAVVS